MSRDDDVTVNGVLSQLSVLHENDVTVCFDGSDDAETANPAGFDRPK